jgi:hypothetical protein
MVTPGRFSGEVFPFRFSFQRLSPISQKAKACSAVVLPELLGPIKTTGLPSSISTLPNLLKFRTVSFVSIGQFPQLNQWDQTFRRLFYAISSISLRLACHSSPGSISNLITLFFIAGPNSAQLFDLASLVHKASTLIYISPFSKKLK